MYVGTGCSGNFCFTIHCNPSFAYIVVKDVCPSPYLSMVPCQVSVKVDLFFKNILNICILSTDQLSKTVLTYRLYKQVQNIHCVMGFQWVIIAKATPSLDPSYRHMSITPAARFHTWRTRYWYFHPIQKSEMIRKRCKSILICFILVTSFFLTKKKTVSQSK